MTSVLRVKTGGRTRRGQLACRAGAAAVAAAACTAAAVAAGSPAAHAQPGRPAAAAHHAARAPNTPCVDTANTPEGPLAEGATVALTWTTVPGCADGQTGTIAVTDQATQNTTIITQAAPLQPPTYQWTVNVPPGTYTFAVNDGTGNKNSGTLTVTGARAQPSGGASPAPAAGTSSAPASGTGTGLVAAVISQTQFCSFLPPSPGGDIGASESDATVFCTTAGLTDGAQAFPAGFIKTAHFVSCGTGCVQVTGTIDPAA